MNIHSFKVLIGIILCILIIYITLESLREFAMIVLPLFILISISTSPIYSADSNAYNVNVVSNFTTPTRHGLFNSYNTFLEEKFIISLPKHTYVKEGDSECNISFNKAGKITNSLIALNELYITCDFFKFQYSVNVLR